MSVYVLTPLAKADIFNIWSYIAEDNENAADRVEQAIYDACAFLAKAPMRGRSRRDLTAVPFKGSIININKSDAKFALRRVPHANDICASRMGCAERPGTFWRPGQSDWRVLLVRFIFLLKNIHRLKPVPLLKNAERSTIR